MITYESSKSLTDLALAYQLVQGLESLYPAFSDWYVNTCMPGVLIGSDLLLVAKDKQEIVGVALAKKGKENKLRCVRVKPQYQSKGVGIHLIERSLKALNVDKPHCTVAEEMIHLYSRPFVNHFHFDLTRVDKGSYRQGKLEYVFN